MSRLIVSRHAGFCFGVRRSVALAQTLLEGGGDCWSMGHLIHNAEVVERFRQQGLQTAETVEEIPAGARVITRAHGLPRADMQALEARAGCVVDGTCPNVARIHRIVSRASAQGRIPLILGNEHHPEVRAVCGWCSGALVFSDDVTLAEWLGKDEKRCAAPYSVVFQTTLNIQIVEKSKKILKKLCTNSEVFDTICVATSTRQEDARILARDCGAMVVIGDRHSANSLHLAEICRAYCGSVQFIENARELDTGPLAGAEVIGVTAGASTPEWIIKEVIQKMSDEIKIEEMTAEPEVLAEESAAAEPVEKTFDELLEDSIKTIYNGDVVGGIVAAITNTEVSVDLGTKHSGYIPVAEFEDGTGRPVSEIIAIGDKIEAIVVRVNDVEGTVMLSKKRLDAAKTWNEIEAASADGAVVEGKVTEENKGGVVVDVNGVRVFVPASQTGLGRDVPMTELVGTTTRLKITEVNKGRKRVVGSIRAIASKERKERQEKIWNEIEVGKVYQGTVKSLTSYGAFVDIGGIDGMVHVSEISWKRIKQPSDVLSVGDEVEVYIISFDRENRKISLGYRKAEDNPWAKFTAAYEIGSVADVKIVKMMTFGAFAEVVPGVDGLIHISQIANRRIGKPEEVLTVGETVQAKITNIDYDKQKISLSIRALSEPERAPKAEEPEEEYVSSREPEDDALVYEVSATGEANGLQFDVEE